MILGYGSPQYGSAVELYQGPPAPVGIAVGASGTVYWVNYNTGELLSLAKGASSPTVLLSGLSYPAGVAVDSQGNVYFDQYFAYTVSELPAGSSTPEVLFNASTYVTFLALDQNGNVFVVTGAGCNGQASASGNADSIVEWSKSTGSTSTIFSGQGIGEVYVSSSENVYYATCSGTVEELPAGSSTPQTLISGLSPSTGVAVDAYGDLIFTQYSSGVYALPSGSTTPINLTTAGETHYGLTLDSVGDVFYTDNLGGGIWEIPVSTSTTTTTTTTTSTRNMDSVTVAVSPTSVIGAGNLTVSGAVTAASGSVGGTAATVTVENPNGDNVIVAEAPISGTGSSGTYSLTLTAGGTSSWIGGTYKITATYGTLVNSAPATESTTFVYATGIVTTSTFEVSAPPIQTSVNGSIGIQVGYYNTFSETISGFVWVSALNSEGQTVGIFVGSVIVTPDTTISAFVPTFNLPSGNYTVQIFATTESSIPISPVSTTSLSI